MLNLKVTAFNKFNKFKL